MIDAEAPMHDLCSGSPDYRSVGFNVQAFEQRIGVSDDFERQLHECIKPLKLELAESEHRFRSRLEELRMELEQRLTEHARAATSSSSQLRAQFDACFGRMDELLHRVSLLELLKECGASSGLSLPAGSPPPPSILMSPLSQTDSVPAIEASCIRAVTDAALDPQTLISSARRLQMPDGSPKTQTLEPLPVRRRASDEGPPSSRSSRSSLKLLDGHSSTYQSYLQEAMGTPTMSGRTGDAAMRMQPVRLPTQRAASSETGLVRAHSTSSPVL